MKTHLALAGAFDQMQRTSDAENEWRGALAINLQSSAAIDGLTKDLLLDKDFRSLITLLQPAAGSVALSEPRTLDLAFAYGQLGMLEDASAVLHKALRTHPSSVQLAKALAGVLVLQARKQEAEDILEITLKQHPQDVGLRLLYLRILVLNDEAERGERLGHKLLAETPHNWEVLNLNGVLEQRAGNYLLARDHLRESVALNPNNIESRHSLGSVLAKLKDAPGAREQLEKALALGSQDPEIRFELAAVLRTLGEDQEAKRQLELYQAETQQKSDLTQAAAEAAFADQKAAAGDFQQAVSLYREALAAAPKEASLAYKLAMALDKAGDIANERTALEQAIQIDPNMAEAQSQLGFLASRAGETLSAEEHFRSAVHASPGFAKAWINLAATFFLEPKIPDAKEAVARALQLEPHNAQAQELSQALNEASAEPRR
ncbi:MAG: tetratricopeptide repeat protein [Candidatus Sulfotelmatobacter sp.]